MSWNHLWQTVLGIALGIAFTWAWARLHGRTER